MRAKPAAGARPRQGRPRLFDVDEALDKAIGLFSAYGYAATSMQQLAQAMGVVEGSIYKAFGDKRTLHRKALERYLNKRTAVFEQAAKEGANARERLLNVLRVYVGASTDGAGQIGCMTLSTAVELASSDPVVAARIDEVFRTYEDCYRDLIQSGHEDGSIPRSVDSRAVAKLITSVTQGMRVVGKAGRSEQDMTPIVDAVASLLG